MSNIRKGDEVAIKPEWQDDGDGEFRWVAVTDDEGGRLSISPIGTGLEIPPVQRVDTVMVERIGVLRLEQL